MAPLKHTVESAPDEVHQTEDRREEEQRHQPFDCFECPSCLTILPCNAASLALQQRILLQEHVLSPRLERELLQPCAMPTR